MKKVFGILFLICLLLSCEKNPTESEKGNNRQINIKSTPARAGIILNGKYIDQDTPYILNKLDEGIYSIQLFHASCEDTIFQIDLTKDHAKIVDINLQKSNILMGYRIHYHNPDSIGVHFQSHFLYNEILLDSIILKHPSGATSKFIFLQQISYQGFVDYPYGFNNFINGKRGEWKLVFYFRSVNSSHDSFTKRKTYWA
ncbi:hypothetical protein JW964_19245, partial [candidate division KSB1 bacterium]|nr:hypothetical protein [candidate division KSB1 bacterium]